VTDDRLGAQLQTVLIGSRLQGTEQLIQLRRRSPVEEA
jgi:hypothetical protein